jgi:hypothetical protein
MRGHFVLEEEVAEVLLVSELIQQHYLPLMMLNYLPPKLLMKRQMQQLKPPLMPQYLQRFEIRYLLSHLL